MRGLHLFPTPPIMNNIVFAIFNTSALSRASGEDSTNLLIFGSFESLSQENPTEGRILF
jgi:hypothetical protein